MTSRLFCVFLFIGCSTQRAPEPSPVRPPTAPTAKPAESAAPTPAVAGTALDAGLAKELEGIDQNPSRSVGPDAEGVVRQFIEAVNAHDPSQMLALSSPECSSGECADLAREAAKKFALRQAGSVSVRGGRAMAGADVVCTGGKNCDFVYLWVERRVVTVSDQGILSSAWAWRVVEVSENEKKTRAWLDAAEAESVAASTGEPTKVPSPSGDVAMGAVGGGGVANAAAVLSGMRAGFRRCYARSLAEDPNASGSVRLELRIGPAGEVTDAKATTTGRFPPNAVACIEARARAAQFDPPAGGAAKLVVPLTFTRAP